MPNRSSSDETRRHARRRAQKLTGLAALSACSLVIAILTATACSEPDWMGAGLPAASSGKATEVNATEPDCGAAGFEDEPAGGGGAAAPVLGPECCDGKAHCVEEAKIPAEKRDSLDKCPSGGYCVPTEQILGTTPTSCEAGDLGKGACVSKCVKKARENEGVISKGSCAADQLCSPCELGGEKTGACEAKGGAGGGGGTSGGAAKPARKCKDPKTSSPSKKSDAGDDDEETEPAGKSGPSVCCEDQGACVGEKLVPEDNKANLEQKECAKGKLCAPKELIPPDKFKPKKCHGESLAGEYDGVCLSNCLTFDTFAKLASSQGDCDDDHRCIPCSIDLLIFQKPTGAPGCPK